MSTYGYDEGGAIPTDDEDDSGAAPVLAGETANGGGIPVEDDATGVNDAQRGGQAAPDDAGGDALGAIAKAGKQNPIEGARQFPGNAKRIIAYLTGADAAHPASLQQAGSMVDPEGRMPPADRNLLALDAVRDQYGDETAWSLMQSNRVAYNAQQAFAKVALQGSPQKPADINAAIDAANKAQANVLDGSNVQFARGPGGVTATVTIPGSQQPQQIQLSPQAFAAFLDVGGDGQWDKVVEHSAPATLQRLANQYPLQAQRPNGNINRLSQLRPQGPQAQAPQAQAPQAPTPAEPNQQQGHDDFLEAHPAPDSEAVRTGKPVVHDLDAGGGDQPAIPGTHDKHGHYLGPKEAENSPYDPEIKAQADEMFKGQGVTSQMDKSKFMSNQQSESDKRQNAIDVASEKGKLANERARISGGLRNEGEGIKAKAKVESAGVYSEARKQQALARLQAEAAREQGLNNRAGNRGVASAAIALINSGQIDKMTPQQRAMAGFDQPQQPQQPAQQSAPPAPQNPAQRQVGQIYTSPTGKRGKWMGNGWQAVQ